MSFTVVDVFGSVASSIRYRTSVALAAQAGKAGKKVLLSEHGSSDLRMMLPSSLISSTEAEADLFTVDGLSEESLLIALTAGNDASEARLAPYLADRDLLVRIRSSAEEASDDVNQILAGGYDGHLLRDLEALSSKLPKAILVAAVPDPEPLSFAKTKERAIAKVPALAEHPAELPLFNYTSIKVPDSGGDGSPLWQNLEMILDRLDYSKKKDVEVPADPMPLAIAVPADGSASGVPKIDMPETLIDPNAVDSAADHGRASSALSEAKEQADAAVSQTINGIEEESSQARSAQQQLAEQRDQDWDEELSKSRSISATRLDNLQSREQKLKEEAQELEIQRNQQEQRSQELAQQLEKKAAELKENRQLEKEESEVRKKQEEADKAAKQAELEKETKEKEQREADEKKQADERRKQELEQSKKFLADEQKKKEKPSAKQAAADAPPKPKQKKSESAPATATEEKQESGPASATATKENMTAADLDDSAAKSDQTKQQQPKAADAALADDDKAKPNQEPATPPATLEAVENADDSIPAAEPSKAPSQAVSSSQGNEGSQDAPADESTAAPEEQKQQADKEIKAETKSPAAETVAETLPPDSAAPGAEVATAKKESEKGKPAEAKASRDAKEIDADAASKKQEKSESSSKASNGKAKKGEDKQRIKEINRLSTTKITRTSQEVVLNEFVDIDGILDLLNYRGAKALVDTEGFANANPSLPPLEIDASDEPQNRYRAILDWYRNLPNEQKSGPAARFCALKLFELAEEKKNSVIAKISSTFAVQCLENYSSPDLDLVIAWYGNLLWLLHTMIQEGNYDDASHSLTAIVEAVYSIQDQVIDRDPANGKKKNCLMLSSLVIMSMNVEEINPSRFDDDELSKMREMLEREKTNLNEEYLAKLNPPKNAKLESSVAAAHEAFDGM